MEYPETQYGTCSSCKFLPLDSDTAPCAPCGCRRGDTVVYYWQPKDAEPDPTAVVNPVNDGSTADYYVLPQGATQLQDLISFRNMNAQLGEIQRAVYRYGQGHHSSRERDLKKIIFYAQAELERLATYED